jgi:vacuolar-type H+-ATPase subunit I/STV1
MRKDNNRTYFNGAMNLNGPTQIATGDIINNYNSSASVPEKLYRPDPIWCSKITMSILTWVSVIIGVFSLFPVSNIVECVMNFFSGNIKKALNSNFIFYLFFFFGLLFLLIIVIALRKITKNQTRHPLIFNFAISGVGGKLTLEKVHICKCPKCGGKMKYYNKPIEWKECMRSDGSYKREVVKKVPALECKRNAKHWYEVDPAEEYLK